MSRRTPRYEAIVTHGYPTPRRGSSRRPDEVGVVYVYDYWSDRIVFRVATENRKGGRTWRLDEAMAAARERAAELNEGVSSSVREAAEGSGRTGDL